MPELDLGTYLADDTLALRNVPSDKHPRGKTYRVPSPSAKFGLLLQRMMQIWGTRANASQSDEEVAPPTDDDVKSLIELVTDEEGNPVDFTRRLLGVAYDQMVDDGVSTERLGMIRTVVMAHYTSGAEAAKMLTQAGEAQARGNRATRRATTRTAKKTAGSRSRKASTATDASATATTSPTSGSSNAPTGAEPPAAATG